MRGLSSFDAQNRLAQFGPNQVRETESRSAWYVLFEQFKSPLVLILLFACVISFTLGEFVESIAIAVILLVNAMIGFFQEYRAETAVQALREITSPKARVLRDGRPVEISATEVVPGDFLLLEAGDIVAADGKIIEASRLQINEAVLTGESLPVHKFVGGELSSKSLAERTGFLFMGTSVAMGTALCEVTATGMKTELGKIAHLLSTTADTMTPLQNQLAKVGRMLLFLCLGIVGLVFVIGYFQGRPWLELMVFSISLAVAAVPEGMPAIVTVALAFGVQRMAARNALIRKLPSVETLGSVSVICTDKTGTLTTGLMRVREIWGPDHRQIILAAASCCDAELGPDRQSDIGDPTEIAILLEALERGILKSQIESKNPRLKTEPFDSERKRMSIFRQDRQIYVKGALESLLPLCHETQITRDVQLAINEMTDRGLRVLAIATGQRESESDLSLLGLIGLADPPRTEVIQAIAEAKSAGILPVMITGDHPNTAAAVALELGLISEGESRKDRIHARATPEDKLNIIRAWKSKGAIVAMTGDGVNDAPALREAHIGIAMGKTGTQVTQQSADLILADDNFATIVAAVREGRGVYQNIRKAVIYLLTGNFAEIVMVLGATILGLPIPFLASHLLWINLVSDALPGLTLIADPVSVDIMKHKPRPATEKILGLEQWLRIALTGTLEAISIGALYWIQLQESGPELARSYAFTGLVASELFRALSARSTTRTYWQVGVLNNFWLLGVVILTLVLQISLHFIPLTQNVFGLHPIGLHELLLILPFSLVTVSVLEVLKLLRRSDRQ